MPATFSRFPADVRAVGIPWLAEHLRTDNNSKFLKRESVDMLTQYPHPP